MPNNNKIKMYTDGACKGNPGIGGWGVYVLGKNDETDLNGFDINTTNNKMELTAVIEGLKILKNKDLWKELDYLVREHIIDWEWVRGHSGNPGNERADLLANKGILEHLEKRSNFK